MATHSSSRSRRTNVEPNVGDMAAEVGRQARRSLQQTRDTAVERMQRGASEYLSSATQAIRLGGDQMRQDGYDGSAHALDRAAGTIEEVGGELASQNLLQAGAEVLSIAKRRPGVTLGVLLGTGFLIAFSMRKNHKR